MKAERIVELKKGVAEIRVLVELHELDTEGDPWEGISAQHEKWYDVKFELDLNGEKYKADADIDYVTNDAMIHKIHKMPEEVKTYINFKTKKTMQQILLRAESAKAVADAIQSAKDEVTTPEAKAFFDEKEKATLEAERKSAAYVVEECEKVLKRGGQLMNDAEKKQYLENYNNVMNEGGEGFLPKIWTKGEYEAALKVLGR